MPKEGPSCQFSCGGCTRPTHCFPSSDLPNFSLILVTPLLRLKNMYSMCLRTMCITAKRGCMDSLAICRCMPACSCSRSYTISDQLPFLLRLTDTSSTPTTPSFMSLLPIFGGRTNSSRSLRISSALCGDPRPPWPRIQDFKPFPEVTGSEDFALVAFLYSRLVSARSIRTVGRRKRRSRHAQDGGGPHRFQ